MHFLSYLFFLLVVNCVRLVPFALLYAFSDGLYFLLFKLIGYRKKVVYANLQTAFPNHSATEIEGIAKRFYHHLCDIALESTKGFTMSKKQLLERFRINDPDSISERYFKANQNIIGLTAHYGNWEWGAQTAAMLVPFAAHVLYKPLSNKRIDAYFRKKRANWGCHFASIQETAKLFAEPTLKPAMYLLAADQSPSNIEKAIWAKLLGQDTACLHGPEHYGIKYKLPLVYCHVRKVKRGYYLIDVWDLGINYEELQAGEITQKYMSIVEKVVQEKPDYWLWSHRRWKHKRNFLS